MNIEYKVGHGEGLNPRFEVHENGAIVQETQKENKIFLMFNFFSDLFKTGQYLKCVSLISAASTKMDNFKFGQNFQPDNMIQLIDLINIVQIEQKVEILESVSIFVEDEFFSKEFTNNQGDIFLSQIFQNVSEKADYYILRILCKIKLSPNFPIVIFNNYFHGNSVDLSFLKLFENCMDSTPSIGELFCIFVQFPEPEVSSFFLFCRIIVLFFRHSLNEDVFKDSGLYEKLARIVPAVQTINEIILFIQITARISNSYKILNLINPNLFFSLIVNFKDNKLVIPVLTIIDSLIKNEVPTENLDEFIQQYVNHDVVNALLANITSGNFIVRIRSLVLLNTFIDASNMKLMEYLFPFFVELKGEQNVIESLFLSDIENVCVEALKLANYVFVYAANGDNENLRNLLRFWTESNVIEAIQQIAFSENDRKASAALLLYKKIDPVLKMMQ